jgi:acyl-coenzyme A synthetase/AMP-(fatty) acid ligase
VKLVKAVVHQARRSAQDPAVAFGGGVASFAQLMGSTAAAIEALTTLGVRPGALVLLDIRNPIHHIAMIYALALMGVRSGSVGTAYVAQQSGPRPDLFLTDRDDLEAPGLPLRKVDQRWFAFDAAKPVDFSALEQMPGFPSPDDVVRYVYSSGTTGRPKCVGLTNASLELRIAHTQLSLSQRTLTGAAINLMGFSTIAGIMSPLLTHSVGVLLCFAANSAETLNMIRMFNISAVSGAVVQIQNLLTALGNAAPPASLRCVSVGGAKLPHRLLTEIRSRLCSYVMGGYGSTEMGGLTFASAVDFERHEGAAGYRLPWATIETVDDAGNPLPPGTEGVIRARSPEQAFYVDELGNRVDATQGGWFYPGDIGRIEPDGLVVITGRTGDVINRGGVVVAPELIEEVLRLDPQVADVAVVGAPNAAGIDEIWAGIVPRATPLDGARITAAARLKLNERVPDRLFQIEAVPRNENGKVMRNVLRETLRRMLQAQG